MKTWKILAEYKPGEDITQALLKNRGVTSVEDLKVFLSEPSLKELVDAFPQSFKYSLKQAKDFILEAIKVNTPIVVHGDYDADGICATAILYLAIKNDLQYENVFYFIPNRFDHGYGLSINSIDSVISNIKKVGDGGAQNILFITVDSGITAGSEVAYIKSLGHQVIVTDHHQKPDVLPSADVIVWTDKLVGASIAWLLSRALGSKNTQDVALAALATVTDLQPLMGINRLLVKKGLEVINTNPLPGLKKLIQLAGKSENEIGTYDLGWVIGPRINAAGRLVEATDSLRLFVEKDEGILEKIAEKLNAINVERQDKTMEMFELASANTNGELPKILISVDQNYHEGIIGLVAAKLVQKYYRPSIVISLSDGFGKGSVRSIPGIDIISVLRRLEHLFVSLGGHPMAAGFTIEKAKIEELKTGLHRIMQDVDDSVFQQTLSIDMQIPAMLINLETLKKLEMLKPFGLGNEEPVFATTNMGIVSYNTVGNGAQHLILRLYNEGNYYKAISFGGAALAQTLNFGDKVDIAYTLKRNDYNGKTYVDMVVKDIKRT